MTSCKKPLICAFFLIFTCFCSFGIVYAQGTSSSQTLINKLPDDVLVFAATSGGDVLKPEFEKTIFGRVWNDQSVQTFIQSIQKNLLQKVQEESGSPEAAAMFNMVKNIAGLVASRPIIIGAAQKSTQQGPPVYGFAFMDAGPKKDQIAGILTNLEAMAGEGEIVDVNVGSFTFYGPKDAGDVPGYWGWIGNYLVFAINDGEGLAIKYLQEGSSGRTQSYMESSSGNDLFAVYLNVEKGLGMIKAIAAMEGGQEEFAQFETVIAQLGIDKIKTITSRTRFEGTGIVSDELIEIPQPRTGLFASVRPINLDMINMGSPNAVSLSVVNIDIAGIYDTVMNAVKSVAGSDFEEIEQGIGMVEQQAQIKIRQGLLESLNGQMAFYALPGGVSLQSIQGGFVVIAGLKNPQLFQDSMAAIGKFASEQAEGMVQVSSQEQNGRTLNTFAIVPLAVAQIMPTWTIVGDNVVIGSNPVICNAAVEQITSTNAPSIRSTESFRNATADMPSGLISFQYTDSKVQLTQTMVALQQVWPMATMLAAQQGITLPVVLPNLTDIFKDVTPSVQYSWFDEKGLHSKYKGSGIEPGIGAVAGVALGLGIMMPALSRVRQQARQTVSRANLRQLSLASILYGEDNNGQLPANFEQLKEYYRDDRVLENPLKPAGFSGPSYILVPGLSTKSIKAPQNTVVIYENPAYCSDKVNMAFLDGHVESLTRSAFLEKLKATYEELRKPMPEIKFNN